MKMASFGASVSAASPGALEETKPRLLRTKTACEACRIRKVKCTDLPCTQCLADGILCIRRRKSDGNIPKPRIPQQPQWPTPSKLEDWVPYSDILSQDRLILQNILKTPEDDCRNAQRTISTPGQMSLRAIYDSFTSLSVWRSIDKFKTMFAKQNPDAEGFSAAWDLLDCTDALANWYTPDVGHVITSNTQDCYLTYEPHSRRASESASDRSNLQAGATSLQHGVSLVYDLIQKGNIGSACWKLKSVVDQAYWEGLHLISARTMVLTNDSHASSSLWRQILKLDEDLSIATGRPPAIPKDDVRSTDDHSAPSRSESNRMSFELALITRDILREKSWSNKKIYDHSSKLHKNIKALTDSPADPSQPPVERLVSPSVFSREVAVTSSIALRTHAYVMCLNCHAKTPKQAEKTGDNNRGAQSTAAHSAPKRRGNKGFQRCYQSILKSADLVLSQFCILYKHSPRAVARDWVACHYAFAAAAILGIAGVGSARYNNADSNEYKHLTNVQVVFDQLRLEHPSSRLFRVAGARLSSLLSNGNQAEPGREDADQPRVLHVTETSKKMPSLNLATDMDMVKSESISPSRLAPSNSDAGPSDCRTMDVVQQVSPKSSPRKRAMMEESATPRKCQKLDKLPNAGNQRSSIPVYSSAPPLLTYQSGNQSFPRIPLMHGLHQVSDYSSSNTACANQGFFDLPTPVEQNQTEQISHVAHVPSLPVLPPTWLGPYPAMGEDLHVELLNNYGPCDAVDLSYPSSDEALVTVSQDCLHSDLATATTPEPITTTMLKHEEAPNKTGIPPRVKKWPRKRRSTKSPGPQEGFVNKTLKDYPEAGLLSPTHPLIEPGEAQSSGFQPSANRPGQYVFQKNAHSASFKNIETPETIERRALDRPQEAAHMGNVALWLPDDADMGHQSDSVVEVEAVVLPMESTIDPSPALTPVLPLSANPEYTFQQNSVTQPTTNDSYIARTVSSDNMDVSYWGLDVNRNFTYNQHQMWPCMQTLDHGSIVQGDVLLNLNGVLQYSYPNLNQTAQYVPTSEPGSGGLETESWWMEAGGL